MNFSTPFSDHFDPSNRMILLTHEIPWDSTVKGYLNQLNNHATGASNINPRIVLGALIVKYILIISGEDKIQMIKQNLYIQYFLGFNSFTSKGPYDSCLFLDIRKRLGVNQLNRINDAIYQASIKDSDIIVDESTVVNQEDFIDPTSSDRHS